MENKLLLSMNIPSGLNQIMYGFYPVLVFKFGDDKQDIFNLNEDGTVMTGNLNHCINHLCYPDLGQ